MFAASWSLSLKGTAEMDNCGAEDKYWRLNEKNTI